MFYVVSPNPQVFTEGDQECRKINKGKIYISGQGTGIQGTPGDLVGGNRRIDKVMFEVFTAALLRILPFWEMMLCH
jgi:hypothetical protein